MAPRSAERTGTARVAVVGADSDAGGRIRQALADRGIPGRRVDLYATVRDEAVLSEYAGEARLIQEPDPEEVAAHDLIFLCEGGEPADRVLAACGERVLIDMVGDGAPLVYLGIHGAALPATQGRLSVPHPVVLMLADLLYPLDGAFGLRQAVATVLRPASDFGEAGVEELRQQTVRLLNFVELPKEVFGSQLAFNVLAQHALRGGGPDLERTVARETAALLGRSESRIDVRLVTVPVFYGHAASVHVRTRRPATAAAAREALEGSEALDLVEDGPARTPLGAAGRSRTAVSDVRADGRGGLSIWAVAGEAAAAAADHAVRVAERLTDL